MRCLCDVRARPAPRVANLAVSGPTSSGRRTATWCRFCSLMSQRQQLGSERRVAFGCLRSLRAPGHSMGSAGCRAARLKPQSAMGAGRVRQNRRRHLLPPSGVAPARELVSVSFPSRRSRQAILNSVPSLSIACRMIASRRASAILALRIVERAAIASAQSLNRRAPL